MTFIGSILHDGSRNSDCSKEMENNINLSHLMIQQMYISRHVIILSFDQFAVSRLPQNVKVEFHSLKLKGSRSHLQISLNITKLCKDEIYTIMIMYV